MTALPKYSREYVDSYTGYVTSACRISKKEFMHKLSKCSSDDFYKFLVRRAKNLRKRSMFNFISCSLSELDVVYHFNDGLHFCVDSIPKTVQFNAFREYGDDLLEKDVYIDFKYNGSEYFLYVTKDRYVAQHDIANSKYTICLFTAREDIRSYNKSRTCDELANFGDYVMLYCVDVAEGMAETYSVVHPNNVWVHDYIFDPEDTALDESKNEEINEHCIEQGIPLREEIINLFNHVMYCYKFRDKLKRKNSKVAKAYKEHKVHTVSSVRAETDRYTSLLESTYNATDKREYKGGHHASPIEHDRIGYFRRSRGRGDYIKVDDDYVYVGNMQGNYSKIRPTHVGGNKTDTVQVYKI